MILFLLIALVATLVCLIVPRLRKFLSYAVLIPLAYGATYLPLALYLLHFDWLRPHLLHTGIDGGLTALGYLFVAACGLPAVAAVILFLRWLRRDRYTLDDQGLT